MPLNQTMSDFAKAVLFEARCYHKHGLNLPLKERVINARNTVLVAWAMCNKLPDCNYLIRGEAR